MLVIGATTGAGLRVASTVPSGLGDASAALFATSVGLPAGADSQAAPPARA